jgi:hypothetical protein
MPLAKYTERNALEFGKQDSCESQKAGALSGDVVSKGTDKATGGSFLTTGHGQKNSLLQFSRIYERKAVMTTRAWKLIFL